ncbi:hypothetical protein [Schlesneria paludicola]|uniref:hypothetical protein n=1 Tax=Schlesneria paludicola TaxID=360056 RepID=UPI00029A03FE|nr:hypothetical protein [Schlesneria paludicola]
MSGFPNERHDLSRSCASPRMASAVMFAFASICLCPLLADEPTPSALEGLRLKSPQIPVAITGELRSLNETLSQGVAPSENAAVVLTQLFGDGLFEPALRDDSLEMLGIEQLSATAPRFTYVEPFIKSLGVKDLNVLAGRSQQLEQQIFAGANRLWTQPDLPDLHAFLTANQAALDLLRIAAIKPHYYAPLLTVEDPPQLLTVSLALERRLPFVVQVLCSRALNRLATQNGLAAMDDLLTCQKLAVLLANGSPLDVSGMKSHQMDAFAANAALGALASGQLLPGDAKYYLAGLKQFAQLPPSSIAADRGERAILHQELELLKQDQTSVREFFELPDDEKYKPLNTLRLSELPWDLAKQRADEVHDRFVKVIAMSNRAEREQLCEQLDKDYHKWTDTSDETNRAIAEAFDKDVTELTRWIGETMAMSLRPWYVQRIAADERARVRRDLVMLGMALVAFRGDEGQFPQALSELAPKYLEILPLDAHSDQPFRYVRIDQDQATLSSLGGNRQDDAGQPFNDDRTLELKWVPGNNRTTTN